MIKQINFSGSKCDDSFLTETPEQYYNHDDADVEILFSVTKNVVTFFLNF